MAGLFGDEPEPVTAPPGPSLFGGSSFDQAVAASAPAYRVLARKYRPTRFDDLIGQDALVRTLRNAFAIGRIAHAFMLTGVRGVGKTTTARIVARALNCTGPDGAGGPTADPCGTCADCVAILADRHPDVVEMDAASRTGVDDVREIIDATRFRPMQARTKVFVIDEVHMLSRNAFNALLKTLEEPPPHVKFVFATTELRRVPVTVLSRCQRFDLKRVPADALATHFGRVAAQEGITVAPEALALIARAADGSVRDGLSLLDQAIAQAPGGGAVDAASVTAMLGLADRMAVFDLLEALFAGRPADALAITDRAHEAGADFGMLLQDLLELLHAITRLKTIPALRQSASLPEAERTRGAAIADRLSVPVIGRAWQMLLKGIGEVESAPDRRAAAEMVLIRLCHVADLPPPGDLVRRLTEAGGATVSTSAAMPLPVTALAPVGTRAVVNGPPAMAAPRPQPTPQPAQLQPADAPRLGSLREIAAMLAEQEPLLHGLLVHSVHLVRLAPGVIELRPQPDAPRDLAARLSAALLKSTGTRWTIALSKEPGEPTLAEQAATHDRARRSSAADHPLVRAILEAFPGATIDAVHDSTADAYGLPGAPAGGGEPEMPEFAPLDAGYADDDFVDLPEEQD